jgi:hypothetical protein
MLVVNLAHNSKYNKLWANTVDLIRQSSDRLRENYLTINPADFASFPAVIDNNQIVCFSALQLAEEKWGAKIGRVSTRMWIHPDYRHAGKFTSGTKFLNTTYCLPLQLADARILGLDTVFISREENLRGFQEYLKLIKVNCGFDFSLEDQKYNVCGIYPVPESCKQWVAVCHLTQHGYDAWQQAMIKHQL